MNFLSQLLPGFRSVRAPLIGGYLWLVAAWLLFSDDLPRSGESEVYARAAELGEAVGPVALAVAASVAAYLIGSLVKAVAKVAAAKGVALEQKRRHRGRTTSADEFVPLRDLGALNWSGPEDIAWFDGDSKVRDRLQDLVDSKLSNSREAIEGAVAKATERVAIENLGLQLGLALEERAGAGRTVSAFIVWDIGKPAKHQLSERLELPAFSADRDILKESAIKTLLLETTRQIGSEVERLYSEAELRFYVALPLIAILIVLWVNSHDLVWGGLLLVPLALIADAVSLNWEGNLELVEGLRSRRSAEDLEEIAPVFARYEVQAAALANAIEGCDWPALAREAAAASAGPTTPARAGSAGS